MGEIKAPVPVKLILGMFTGEQDLFSQACNKLSEHWGEMDLISQIFPFNHTEYYQAEMGKNLLRQFVSFKNLMEPQLLINCKLLTNQLEEGLAGENKNRRINLDPGYITQAKLILASTKDFSHRIYLNKGIYAEVTLQYSKNKGGWLNLPWTYPDYAMPESKEFSVKVREIYRRQIENKSN